MLNKGWKDNDRPSFPWRGFNLARTMKLQFITLIAAGIGQLYRRRQFPMHLVGTPLDVPVIVTLRRHFNRRIRKFRGSLADRIDKTAHSPCQGHPTLDRRANLFRQGGKAAVRVTRMRSAPPFPAQPSPASVTFC